MTDVTIIQSGKFYLAQTFGDEGAFGSPLMTGSFTEAISWGLAQMVGGGTMIYTEGDKSGLVDVTPAFAEAVNTQIVAAKLRQDLMTNSDRCYIANCIHAIDGPTGRRF